MKFLSTRGGDSVFAAEAIVKGICPSGGLFVPEEFPQTDVLKLPDDYCGIACKIMSSYLTEYGEERLTELIQSAYSSFDSSEVTPVVSFRDKESILELWHGPTMAFKDVALQMLPHLMRESVSLTGEQEEIYIIVATSGDTGKAALEGFRDVDGTRVLVFYPYQGVSKMQQLQMTTQLGKNVDACAIRGNFDDAQTGVKKIFTSDHMKSALHQKGLRMSSANSINFGRLLPQIVYYFYSYKQLLLNGKIHAGDEINFCVPTGNFGDILAGYYAKRMGLPVNKLICASNRNNVLTDFFLSGTYDANRPFYKDMSCSIDILVSSNLERLLYEAAGRNCEDVKQWMKQLKTEGKYRLTEEQHLMLTEDFACGCCSEEDTLRTIKEVYEKNGYLMDPHTAVAQKVYEDYLEKTADGHETVLLSTANPYKFSGSVLSAFETPDNDDFVNVDRLFQLSGMPIPTGITQLKNLPEIHTDVCDMDEMERRVILGKEF